MNYQIPELNEALRKAAPRFKPLYKEWAECVPCGELKAHTIEFREAQRWPLPETFTSLVQKTEPPKLDLPKNHIALDSKPSIRVKEQVDENKFMSWKQMGISAIVLISGMLVLRKWTVHKGRDEEHFR